MTALQYALSGKKVAALLPYIDEEDIEKLPGPVKFAIDNLVSPVGVASLILAAPTGGASIAGRVGLGAALAAKPLAVRGGVDLAGRIASDLAISAGANVAAKGASKALEGQDSKVQTLGSLAAGIVAGGVGGTALNRAVRPTVATRGTPASLAEFRADKSLPQSPNIVELAGGMSGKMPGAGERDFMATRWSGPAKMIQNLTDPSSAIRTTIGKLGVSTGQAISRGNDIATNAWLSAKYPVITSVLNVDNKGNLKGLGGKEVSWRQAMVEDTDLTGLQKAEFVGVKQGLEEAVNRYNLNVKETEKLSSTELWQPNFKKNGEVIRSENLKFRAIEDNAISKNFKRQDVERPETMLYLYAKTALDKEVEEQFNTALKPFYAAADSAFVATEEGARLKKNMDDAIAALAAYKAKPTFFTSAGKASKAGIGDFGSSSRIGGASRVTVEDATAKSLREKAETAEAALARARSTVVKLDTNRLAQLDKDAKKALTDYEKYRRTLDVRSTRGGQGFVAPTGTGSARTGTNAIRRDADDATLTALREAEDDAKKAWSAYKSSGVTPKVTRYKGDYIYDSEHGVEELAQWLNRLRGGGEAIPGLNAGQQIADAARFFSASMDASGPFINLLPTMFSNPGAWAKAIAGNWKALTFDPNLQIKYLSNPENYEIVQKMARNNLAFADIENYVSGARGGLAHDILNPTSRIGKGVAAVPKALYGRAQRGYETGLTIARVEVWKSLETMGWDERKIADWIRESTGAMDSAVLGISPNQRTIESIALFSPRMFRSIASLLQDAVARPHTPEGSLAAQTVLRMLGAGAGLFAVANAAIGELEGLSEEEITKRMEASMDPTNGRQFMSIQVGDQWYGIGGTVRAVTQAVARSLANEDEKAKRDGNPVWDFFSGRLGPAAKAGIQAGELAGAGNWDPYNQIETPMDWVEAEAAGLLPFWAQNAAAEGGWPTMSTVADMAVDIAGLSSKERSSSDVLNSEAFKRHGMPWAELTDIEQDLIKSDHPELDALSKDLRTKEDIMFKDAIARSNTRATDTLKELATYKLPPDERRERIQEVLRDRWVENKGTYETFVDASALGAANTDKRRVTDAYFKLFEDAAIGPANSNQVDWTMWEELNADLDARIAEGEFGPPERARQYLDERRKFKLPEELAFYDESNAIIKDFNYWGQKDEAFNELRSAIGARFPEIDSARELQSMTEIAQAEGDQQLYLSLNTFLKLVNSRTATKRKTLKSANPELKEALTVLGY